jgi:putative tryptophan/tyrosine transport system substrate-binding protein
MLNRMPSWRRLAKLGWSEGSNVQFDIRYSTDDPDRMRTHAEELVGLGPDVIAASSFAVARAVLQRTRTIPVVFINVGDPVVGGLRMDVRWNAADAGLARTYAEQLIGLMPDVILAISTVNLTAIRQATSTVPVVFLVVADPVAQGFVASAPHPGGNLTGFSYLEFSLGSKWLSLLKEVAPGVGRVAVMFNPDAAPQIKFFMPVIEAAAQSLGVQAIATPVRSTADIEPALASFTCQPNGGLMVPGDSFTRVHQKLIANLTGHFRLPSISGMPDFAKDGGLMDYSPFINLLGQFRQAASYVDRILNGSKPDGLPIQRPDKYRFVFNLSSAKTLGLTYHSQCSRSPTRSSNDRCA